MNSKRRLFQSVICQWGELLQARYASISWKFSRWRKEGPARTMEMVLQRWQRARRMELASTNPFACLVSHPENIISIFSKPIVVNHTKIVNFRPTYLETSTPVTSFSHSALHDSPSRPLKNVFEAADAKQKQAKKRNLCVINEHFESVFNTAAATQIVFQRSARSSIGFANANYPMVHATSGTHPVFLPETYPRAISPSPISAIPSSLAFQRPAKAVTVQASSVSFVPDIDREVINQPAQSFTTAEISSSTRPEFLPVVYSQVLSMAGISRILHRSTLHSKLAFSGMERKTAPFPVWPASATTEHVPATLESAASDTGQPALLAVRQSPHQQDKNLLYIKQMEKQLDIEHLQESLIRRVEESLEKKVMVKVETTVARELSPESAYGRHLSARFINDLHSDLVLEKERLGLG